jgi:hypothetical protein
MCKYSCTTIIHRSVSVLMILFAFFLASCNSSTFANKEKSAAKPGEVTINPEDIDRIVIKIDNQAVGAGGAAGGSNSGAHEAGAGGAPGGTNSGAQEGGAGGAPGGTNSGAQEGGAGGAPGGTNSGAREGGAGGAPGGVVTTPGPYEIGVGGAKKIKIEIVLKNGAIIDATHLVNLKVGNTAIADITSGDTLTGKTIGNTELIASYAGKTSTASVVVKDNGANVPNTGAAGGAPTPSTSSSDNSHAMDQLFAEIVDECPKIDQDILVIDLKSGWWAGDAGSFFTRILNTMTVRCNGKVTIEYHHITYDPQIVDDGFLYPGGASITGFQKSNWDEYNQIWLLSGAEDDRADLRKDDSFFLDLQNKIVGSKAALLLGAGFGSIYHANSVSAALGIGPVFMPGVSKGLVEHIYNVTVLSRLQMGMQLMPHTLFSRGIKSIADTVKVGKKTITTDWLSQVPAGSSIIGKTDLGAATIAATSIGPGRQVVLDAGLQRFYAIYNPEEADTLTYLENIIVYLSNQKITVGP